MDTLETYVAGHAQVSPIGDGMRMAIFDASARAYADAQIHDYRRRGRRLPHRPPLTLRLRARFSHPAAGLRGTAGFGLWNYPWARLPAPPRALWFFYASPPSDMPLALGVPGRGWKAAALDTGRVQALALLPLAPLAVPLMRSYAGYRLLWPPIQRAVGAAEAPLASRMDEWHRYAIIWGERRSALRVDGETVLDAPSPRGPMCFVAWVDNQYLVVTPQGRLGWGLLDVPGEQWLEVADLRIER
ncbi:hypothetical protein K2Z83_14710 [Oscillochloris sp. ZM17-4]|uniref:hypothetical protein n=1 Tax=Oscillochloris sp. ZM17-4 TaxID=2866714 RepID=UPI001C732A54|nr:hypothetical protein [Oscillochloris sp. ZM17-4]MBX0328928.1 hypothetical protein [Oscillochloris sp. ZM17-4]